MIELKIESLHIYFKGCKNNIYCESPTVAKRIKLLQPKKPIICQQPHQNKQHRIHHRAEMK
jgi:hypothetical protein